MKQGNAHYKPEELHKLIIKYSDVILPLSELLQVEWDKWKGDSRAEIDEISSRINKGVVYQYFLDRMESLSAPTYVESEPYVLSFLGIKWKSAPIVTKIAGLQGCELIDKVLADVNNTLPENTTVIMLSHHSRYCMRGYKDSNIHQSLLGNVPTPEYSYGWRYSESDLYLEIKGTIPKPTKARHYYQHATTTLSSLKQLTSLPNSEFVVLNDEQVSGLNRVVRVYKELTE